MKTGFCVCIKVAQSCPTLYYPMDYRVHEFPWQEYCSGLPFPSPGDLPNSGIKPGSPTLQADSLLSKPPGKPLNTGVGSLSLLQGIFPTQESNQDLLYCRWIIYQLSYQRSLMDGGLLWMITVCEKCFAPMWIYTKGQRVPSVIK